MNKNFHSSKNIVKNEKTTKYEKISTTHVIKEGFMS